MSNIIINEHSFVPFIHSENIQKKVTQLATQLNNTYKGKRVVFVAILNGAFMFASDLMKEIDLDSEITFVKVQSYNGQQSAGTITELIGLNSDLTHQHVVIIEDIVDTGITMDNIYKQLISLSPKTLKVCTLLYKKEVHKGNIIPDFVGFEIKNKFVVGYGLDYDQKGRNMKDIYVIDTNTNTENK